MSVSVAMPCVVGSIAIMRRGGGNLGRLSDGTAAHDCVCGIVKKLDRHTHDRLWTLKILKKVRLCEISTIRCYRSCGENSASGRILVWIYSSVVVVVLLRIEYISEGSIRTFSHGLELSDTEGVGGCCIGNSECAFDSNRLMRGLV